MWVCDESDPTKWHRFSFWSNHQEQPTNPKQKTTTSHPEKGVSSLAGTCCLVLFLSFLKKTKRKTAIFGVPFLKKRRGTDAFEHLRLPERAAVSPAVTSARRKGPPGRFRVFSHLVPSERLGASTFGEKKKDLPRPQPLRSTLRKAQKQTCGYPRLMNLYHQLDHLQPLLWCMKPGNHVLVYFHWSNHAMSPNETLVWLRSLELSILCASPTWGGGVDQTYIKRCIS